MWNRLHQFNPTGGPNDAGLPRKQHDEVRNPVQPFRRDSDTCAAVNYDRPAWAMTGPHFRRCESLGQAEELYGRFGSDSKFDFSGRTYGREFKAWTSDDKVTG